MQVTNLLNVAQGELSYFNDEIKEALDENGYGKYNPDFLNAFNNNFDEDFTDQEEDKVEQFYYDNTKNWKEQTLPEGQKANNVYQPQWILMITYLQKKLE